MSLRCVDLQIGDGFLGPQQGIDYLFAAHRGKAPIGRKGQHQEFTLALAQALTQIVIEVGSWVVIVEGLSHQQIGIGIEGVGKLFTLIAQIAFDFKFYFIVKIQFAGGQVSPKLLAHAVVAEIGNMTEHPCQRQAFAGQGLVFEIVTGVEVWVAVMA